jgi:hypothetical protein
MRYDSPDVILGYQLRVPAEEVGAHWDSNRRMHYLLRPEIESPLSADPRVWPVADAPSFAREIFENATSGQFEAPNALNLFRLKRHLPHASQPTSKKCQVVGIGVTRDVGPNLVAMHSIILDAEPDLDEANVLELLGMDVCDSHLISILMNCGISLEYLAKLRQTYASSINRHGLFDDVALANQYATDLTLIVPEHAPLFPVALFGIRQSD